MGIRDQVLPLAQDASPHSRRERACREEMIWDCVTCGACVEETCPVSIEHVDHIIDLRRSRA